MPVRLSCPCVLHVRRLVLPALCGLTALPAATAQADEAGSRDEDPSVVVMRTVHPRIAYRGIPLEDHPVQAEATTFPARVFDGLIAGIVDDEALGELGASVPAGDALVPLLERGTAPLGTALTDPTGARMSLGASASVGGAIGGVTRGLGSRVGSTLAPALGTGPQGGGP